MEEEDGTKKGCGSFGWTQLLLGVFVTVVIVGVAVVVAVVTVDNMVDSFVAIGTILYVDRYR